MARNDGKVAHFHGQVNEATLPNGKVVTRERYLLVMMGEAMSLVAQVDEQDHFLYQNQMPISKEDLLGKYGGVVPMHLRGAHVKCTCGSEAVVLVDGPYSGKAICRAYVQFGKHQTSFQIRDGKMELDAKTKSERLADAGEIIAQDITLKRKL